MRESSDRFQRHPIDRYFLQRSNVRLVCLFFRVVGCFREVKTVANGRRTPRDLCSFLIRTTASHPQPSVRGNGVKGACECPFASNGGHVLCVYRVFRVPGAAGRMFRFVRLRYFNAGVGIALLRDVRRVRRQRVRQMRHVQVRLSLVLLSGASY